MLFPARIGYLLLTLALVGCSSQMIPGTTSNPSAPAAGGSTGSGSGSAPSGGGSGGSGGSGGPSSTCGAAASAGAAAYIYVSTQVASGSTSNSQIVGFSASANGSLTPIPGSPFPTPAKSPLAAVAAGSQLFGADGYNIDSFLVHPGGCLSFENSVVAGQGPPADPTLAPYALYLDPKSASLYSFDYNPPDGLGSKFASWSFNPGSGQLTPIGANVVAGNGMLAIASNEDYAVGTFCSIRGGRFIAEYQRGSDGALAFMGYGPMPTAAPGNSWCPSGVAADDSNHIVIGVQAWPVLPPASNTAPDQLAIYSIDNSGTLSTASTWQNMVTTDVGDLSAFQFSPDDRYLVVKGYFGFEVFAWDSATLTPIATIKSGAYCWTSSQGSGCTGPFFSNIAWENDHLYTTLEQQLLVYSVTPSGVTPAAGSPYAVPNAQAVTVLPQTSQ